jgi:hypothetical protein
MSIITTPNRQLSCQRKTPENRMAATEVLVAARRLICAERVFDLDP